MLAPSAHTRPTASPICSRLTLRHPFLTLASCVAWLPLLALGTAPAARGQAPSATTNGTAAARLDAARRLRPGDASEREIRGDEVQVFRVSLEAGQCARLVVERRGVDLLV